MKRLVTSLCVLAALTAPAAAQQLRMASGYPPTSPAHKAIEAFVAHLEANSDITIDLHHSGSLLSFAETPAGLRDGIVDIGVILPPYYPSEFPESNLAANLSMLMTNGERIAAPGAAMAGVMMDYIFNCADCQAGYASQNQVYLGSLSSSTFDLLCSQPVRGTEDLRGRKVRVGAANFGRYVEFYDGVQVAIPANETYEALAQGVVDCVVNSISDLTGYQLADVIDYAMLDVPGGVYSGVDPQNFSRDAWLGLSPEQRDVVLQAAARGSAAATAEYFADAERNKQSAPERGVEVIEPSPEMLAANTAFLDADLAVIATQFSNDYGLSDVDAKIETITGLVAKWKGLMAEWDGSEETLVEIYWTEVFSKLDPAVYGTN